MAMNTQLWGLAVLALNAASVTYFLCEPGKSLKPILWTTTQSGDSYKG